MRETTLSPRRSLSTATALCTALLLALLPTFSAQVARADDPQPTRSLAVMEFDNRSPDSDWPWLAKGLCDMLVTDLSQSRRLAVVERERLTEILREQRFGTTGMYDSTAASRIGQVAKVEWVLFGSFLKEGESLRIEAHLLDVATGELLRVEWVEGQAQEVFELEKKLARQVLARLDVPLTEEERRSLEYAPTDSIPALEHYSRSLAHFDNGKWHEALLECRLAARSDPRYVSARAQVAHLYAEIGEKEHALVAYRRLLEVDSRNLAPERAYLRVGRLFEEIGDQTSALAAYQRVIARHPEYADVFDTPLSPAPAELYAQRETPSSEISRKRQEMARAHEPGMRSLYRTGLVYENDGDDFNAARMYAQVVSFARRNRFVTTRYSPWNDLQGEVWAHYAPRFWRLVRDNRDAELCPPGPVVHIPSSGGPLGSDSPIPADSVYNNRHEWLSIFLAPAGQEISKLTLEVDCDAQSPDNFFKQIFIQVEWAEMGNRDNGGFRGDSSPGFHVGKGWQTVEEEPQPSTRALSMRIVNTTRWRVHFTLVPRSGPVAPSSKQPETGGIDIRFDPVPARAYFIDGKDRTYGPDVSSRAARKLSPGEHLVEAVWPDGRRASELVLVEAGKIGQVLLTPNSPDPTAQRTVLPARGTDTYLFLDHQETVWLLWDTAVRDYRHRSSGSEESDLFCATSKDGLKWSDPRRLSISSSALDARPILQQDRRGVYWMVWCSSRDPEDREQLWIASSQDARKWSFPRKIPLPEMSERDQENLRYRKQETYAFAVDERSRLWLRRGWVIYTSENGDTWKTAGAMDMDDLETGNSTVPNTNLLLDSHNRLLTCARIRRHPQGSALTRSPIHLFAMEPSAAWKELGNVTPVDPYWISMARDQPGRILLATSRPEYFNPRYRKDGSIKGGHSGDAAVFLRVFDDSRGWSNSVLVEKWPKEPFHPSIAALPDGRVLVAYMSTDGITTVLYPPDIVAEAFSQ